MTLYEDSNLNKSRLILMTMMDRSNNTELFRKPVEDGLVLAPSQ
jgi:hypothetical protein